MTIVVTGGRFYNDWESANKVLSLLNASLIVHGAATGADTMARVFAESHGIPHDPNPALWTEFGDNAGPIRNGKMLDKHPGAIVVAFPGEDGTRNCVAQALKKGHIVLEVRTPRG